MKTVIWLLVAAAVAWKFFPHVEEWLSARQSVQPVQESISVSSAIPPADSAPFSCDGRQYCSQMTSCAEAKAFLRNCPGMKMDGDNDGIPCETQWCR
ncbi:excalibur calcium-binding domain-containing protein [Pseudomonas abieticivorans]|uniref:excalibur calcium-binding domain-containing protein n=1 Tax=Pseudomonas abieticivorans TaxID=2931382 RepID=UPI0020C15EF9|nr:excalibur calcium-binding domain-containing protein [Pseudomonas sp. PIA16]